MIVCKMTVCKMIVFKTIQIKVQRIKRELTLRSFQGPTSCCKEPRLRVLRVE